MPGERGHWPLDEIARWRIQYERERKSSRQIDPEQQDLKSRLELAEVLKAEADASLKELKLQLESGELVNREEAIATMEEMFHRVRARMESIPQELGTTFPPEMRSDLIADLRHKVRLVLREMEGWGE